MDSQQPPEVTKEKFSYSKISTYINCPYRFKKRYEEKLFAPSETLPLELGSLCHKGLEIAANRVGKKAECSATEIMTMVKRGFPDDELLGIDDLRKKYFEEWMIRDSKSKLTYDEKMENYARYLADYLSGNYWESIAAEHQFSVDFHDDYELCGFIDRVDARCFDDGQRIYRVVDYKTSKQIYKGNDIKNPLQMVVYALAVEKDFHAIPAECRYDFILINKQQPVSNTGFVQRGIDRLKYTLDEIRLCRTNGIFRPNPSPLCHWCDYCQTNSNAIDDFKYECPYFSLWTPNSKTFAVNKPWREDEAVSGTSSDFWF